MEELGPRTTQQRRAAVPLPPEVWRLIAGHMCLHDWAEVAGTCKATWGLQLDEVHVTSRSFLQPRGQAFNNTGVAWTLKRAREARRLRVQDDEDMLGRSKNLVQFGAATAAVLEADISWASLRGLGIGSTSAFGERSAAETAQSLSAISQLLDRAKNITYLHIILDKPLCLPHFARLKHLHLGVMECLGDVQESLPGLTSLETLSLAWHYRKEDAERPSLNLAGLRRLRSVMLSDVVPAQLTLPQGAALHLCSQTLLDLCEGIWAELAPKLESVNLGRAWRERITDVSQLPKFLVHPSGLKSITLCLGSFGTQERPIALCGSFLQVERLMLDCINGDLCIRLPAGKLSCSLARFMTWRTLVIDFEDMGNFFDCCPAFVIGYRSLRGLNALKLGQCIAQRGIDCRTGYYKYDRDSIDSHWFYSTCTPRSVCRWSLSNFRYEPFCTCGACPHCSNLGRCGADGKFTWPFCPCI